ncbi:hypothetical protein KSF_026750 [Reticulibacter mediterranei]|uniref:Uncharacterized protein n=1 Tax=Reticulibacter mediterranei TaxID=2778369 RepID=A0A8J3N2Z5_9CHLR|nr:hypothetical protein KSF_026750 [Reticulibacter mediterranei]
MLKVSELGDRVKLHGTIIGVMVSVTFTVVVSDPSAITTRELYLPAFSPFPDTATEKLCEVWGANDCLPGLTLVQVAEDGDTDALTICVVVQ